MLFLKSWVCSKRSISPLTTYCLASTFYLKRETAPLTKISMFCGLFQITITFLKKKKVDLTVNLSRPSGSWVIDQNNILSKNNEGLHFCTTEIYVPQEYFRMCYIRRQLMFCCDHVVDDVRGWHMTSWKLEFIILPRPSFGARCPRQGLSPGLYLC